MATYPGDGEYVIKVLESGRVQVWKGRRPVWLNLRDLRSARIALQRKVDRGTEVKVVDHDGRKSKVRI